MELLYFYGLFTILCNLLFISIARFFLLLFHLIQLYFTAAVSCRVVDVLPRQLGKQLFLSRHVVTEAGEFDGGVLVNEKGIIDAILRRDIVNSILANYNDLKVWTLPFFN